MSVERRGTRGLELWAKKATKGYPGVSVDNMTTSWRNGLAFCALIHHFRPDLIDFESLKADNILENNARAYRVAEQHLGIPALLDAEDMLESLVPDRLSILTYVSQFYQTFGSPKVNRNTKEYPVNQSLHTSSPLTPQKTPSSSPVIVGSKIKQVIISSKKETDFKTDKMVTGGLKVKREVCHGCLKAVFIAERILVGSPTQLRHRTCFRCARCKAQLTLANYYVTEKGQFCCETCPDEEKSLTLERSKSEIGYDTSSDSDSPSTESSISTSLSSAANQLLPTNESILETKPRTIFLNDDSNSSITPELLKTADNMIREDGFTTEESGRWSKLSNDNTERRNSGEPKSETSSMVESRLKFFEGESQVESAGETNISSLQTEQEPDTIDEQCLTNDIIEQGYLEQITENIIKSIIGKKPENDISDSKSVGSSENLNSEQTESQVQVEAESVDTNNVKSVGSPEHLKSATAESELQVTEEIKPEDTMNIITDGYSENMNSETTESKLQDKTEIETIDTQNIPIKANVEATEEVVTEYVDENTKVQKNATEKSTATDKTLYPDILNPFGSDENIGISDNKTLNPFGSSDDEEDNSLSNKSEQCSQKNANPFWSNDEGYLHEFPQTPSKSKSPPPRPPPPTLKRNEVPRGKISSIYTSKFEETKSFPSSLALSTRSSPEVVTLRIKKKHKPAPIPPPLVNTSPKLHKNLKKCLNDNKQNISKEACDEVLSTKIEKEKRNQSSKRNNFDQEDIPNTKIVIKPTKFETGEWKRKKGPAPSRPVPQKRVIRALPITQIQQELVDIDVKQTELERQGVIMEMLIRSKTEKQNDTESLSSGSVTSEFDKCSTMSSEASHPGVEVEDLILQLFEIVNEKNELFRRQTELMYLKREKRLEEEHAELEYQIRCSILKQNRMEEDIQHEEELIARMMRVVEQRDLIVNCLELERQREAVEDESIATHMIKYQEKYIEGIDSNEENKRKKKKKKLRILKKKKKKTEVEATADDDKDVDETELNPDKKKKMKKKWFKKVEVRPS